MNIKKRIELIESKIVSACERSGRSPNQVKLIAVSKTHSVEEIREVLDTGLRVIAENKVQESLEKIPHLADQYDEFHFIGHLQSNKIRKVLQLKPVLIHSLDSISTISKMNRILEDEGNKQQILIQVNTSGEVSKSGIEPENTIKFLSDCAQFNNIEICGLMTIGKLCDNEDEIRKCFKILNERFEEAKSLNQSNLEMRYLSMGMSSDFELAIEEGANLIRVGSAIFGPRNYKGSEL